MSNIHRHNWVVVTTDYSFFETELGHWCRENLQSDDWEYTLAVIMTAGNEAVYCIDYKFKHPEDAIMFKLKFGL